MNDFLLYILKSTICLGALYLAFRLFMKRETCFSLNRNILLAIIVSSIIIPLIHLPQFQSSVRVDLIPDFSTNYIQIEKLPIPSTENFTDTPKYISKKENEINIPLTNIFQFLYFSGILITLIVFSRNIIFVLKIIRSSKRIKKHDYQLIISEKEIASFAFGNSIIISQNDFDNYSSSILPHEKAHITLNHFYDLLLLELLKVFHWFNPFLYKITHDLKEVHEYQADEYTLNSGININQYQLLLIEKSVGPKRFALVNSFNHCQIKNRITMMNKKQNNKKWHWKIIFFIPVLTLLLMSFGTVSEKLPISNKITEIVKPELPVNIQMSAVQKALTTQIVRIKDEGNFINNKKVSYDEIKDQINSWRKTSNKSVLLLVDKPSLYNRLDEIRKRVQDSYWIVESVVGSDDLVFFAGDVSKMAKLKNGNYNTWFKTQIMNELPDINSRNKKFKLSYSFIVDKNGKVRNAHLISKSNDSEMNAAIEKIIRRMPEWIPAKRGNENVSVFYRFLWGN